MTIHDHDQVMSKVRLADLKAHLGQHLRKVQGPRHVLNHFNSRQGPQQCRIV
jgi:hypothetical protein